jgi:pimeloyl-ACP methyl ester carboxylesterase
MMKQYLFRWRVLVILLVFVSFSCSDDDNAENSPKQTVLIEATHVLSLKADELRGYLAFSPIDIEPGALQYDVDLYRVKYRTTYKGAEITASGVIGLPKTNDAIGMVSYQHGTLVAHADAPTNLDMNDYELILYAALSSAGFIGVIPDYIGFGESNNILHPYYVEEATAAAVLDNIRAAQEMAITHGINFNHKLFLAGYSQGGYATIAAHKAIEASPLEDINLIASFPAAGGYDIKGMQEYFFDQTTYNQPHYIAYVAMSYKSYYGWPDVLTDFFQEPYASKIPGLFDGTKGASAINSQLTTSIPDLIQPDVRANIDANAKYGYLINAFHDNSLLDWTPTIPMHMYHGDEDATVPYENSVSTYNHFIANGASPSVVTLTALPGSDHSTGIIPYTEDFIKKLQDLK